MAWTSSMSSQLRRDVLRAYRQAMQLSRSWQALEATQTASERTYIKEEARRLFRKNQHLTDSEEIQRCLEEARSRIALAHHYRNPYPRLVNVAPNTVMASRLKKAQVRATRQSKPVYLHSQDD